MALPLRRSDEALRSGFTFLIPDYSLLCPGSGHDMLDDVMALGAWIRESLNEALNGVGLPPVNAEDLAVIGQSAGGYLTYLMVSLDWNLARCQRLRL